MGVILDNDKAINIHCKKVRGRFKVSRYQKILTGSKYLNSILFSFHNEGIEFSKQKKLIFRESFALHLFSEVVSHLCYHVRKNASLAVDLETVLAPNM